MRSYTDEEVVKARSYADRAFKKHNIFRKYTGENYITHCDDIIAILEQYTAVTNDMKIAIHLHDVVEDTSLTVVDICISFDEFVSNDVYWLTDKDNPRLNRKQRKAQSARRLSHAPARLQNIKLGDLISNYRSIRVHDPKFAVVFREEALVLVDVMKKTMPVLVNVLIDELDKPLGVA